METQRISLNGQEFLRVRPRDSRRMLGIGSTQFYMDAQAGGWETEREGRNKTYYLVPIAYAEKRLQEMKADEDSAEESPNNTEHHQIPPGNHWSSANNTESSPESSVATELLERQVKMLKEQVDSLNTQIASLNAQNHQIVASLLNEQEIHKAMLIMSAAREQRGLGLVSGVVALFRRLTGKRMVL